MHASKILQYEHGGHQKWEKLTQSSGNRSERIHLGVDDPIPQGNQARAGVPMYPKSKDPLDLGVDLYTS
jgi:hypothetical protein